MANTTASKTVQIATNVQWVGSVLPIDTMDVDTDNDHGDGVDEAKGTALRGKLFLHQRDSSLELWYLDRVNPIMVMDINVGFETHFILSSAISNDGRWICASNNEGIKCWRICIEGGKTKALRLRKVFECEARGASTMTFSKNSGHLFITPTITTTVCPDDDDEGKVDDSKTTNSEDIGHFLDENRDGNAQIIRIKLDSKDKGVSIDKVIRLKQVGHHLISSLKLNVDSTLCSIVVPSLMFGAVVHVHYGRLFYSIPRRNGCNVSCIEFQRSKNTESGSSRAQEVVFVVYADSAIKMFQFDSYSDPKRLMKEAKSVRLHQWVTNNTKIWESYNGKNPFAFTSILFNQATQEKALMLRPEYMFSMMINKTLPSLYSVGVGVGGKGRAKRLRIDQMIPSPFGKPEGGMDKVAREAKTKRKRLGGNYLRVIRKYDPIVHAQFIADNALLIVHAPWRRVSSKFQDPAFRKMYAT